MKKVNFRINEIISNLSGNMLGICLNDNMLNSINNNDKITSCDVLSKITRGKDDSGRKQKNFDIKKLRKKFKKKRLNYIIGNIEHLEQYFKTFIYDSIYINKGEIYLYTSIKDYDYDKIERKYKRYHINVEREECIDGLIFKIEVKNTKSRKIKDRAFTLLDFLLDLVELIGDIL